ncbi:hypothetical protein ACJX0J_031839, partial [Zea mays]
VFWSSFVYVADFFKKKQFSNFSSTAVPYVFIRIFLFFFKCLQIERYFMVSWGRWLPKKMHVKTVLEILILATSRVVIHIYKNNKPHVLGFSKKNRFLYQISDRPY